jgi:hypothetical protein
LAVLYIFWNFRFSFLFYFSHFLFQLFFSSQSMTLDMKNFFNQKFSKNHVLG